jgi:predicted RNA binding protein YcfA (HicA-like mRNA interferase family)
MTKKEKLFERIKNNPKNVKFSDLKQLLLDENFILDRISGSHHIFRYKDIVFVIPMHKNQVKSVYIKRVIDIIEELRSK